MSNIAKGEKLVDDLRHLDWVREVIIQVNQNIATILLQEAKPLTQVIYTVYTRTSSSPDA
jgi:hypothetical protein